MNDTDFKRSVIEYNDYEDRRDDRYMSILCHIKANVKWNRQTVSRVVNKSYSLKPLDDDTTLIPERWWTNLAFYSYLEPAHSLLYEYIAVKIGDSYLFNDLVQNITPLYRRQFGAWGAVVLQYLDLRNELWQSLPF